MTQNRSTSWLELMAQMTEGVTWATGAEAAWGWEVEAKETAGRVPALGTGSEGGWTGLRKSGLGQQSPGARRWR